MSALGPPVGVKYIPMFNFSVWMSLFLVPCPFTFWFTFPFHLHLSVRVSTPPDLPLTLVNAAMIDNDALSPARLPQYNMTPS
jgi:hypothetical protein